MNIKLDVPVGKFREFTSEELKELNILLADSTKVSNPARPQNRRNRR